MKSNDTQKNHSKWVFATKKNGTKKNFVKQSRRHSFHRNYKKERKRLSEWIWMTFKNGIEMNKEKEKEEVEEKKMTNKKKIWWKTAKKMNLLFLSLHENRLRCSYWNNPNEQIKTETHSIHT